MLRRLLSFLRLARRRRREARVPRQLASIREGCRRRGLDLDAIDDGRLRA